jgi:hypothetical protein
MDPAKATLDSSAVLPELRKKKYDDVVGIGTP